MSCFWSRGHFILSISCLKKKKKNSSCFSQPPSSMFLSFLWTNLSCHHFQIQRSRNKQMKEMFPEGFGIHHAGMLRSDRSMMESMFSKGHLKVLVCTATLAWGVNLPAHAVIIKVLFFWVSLFCFHSFLLVLRAFKNVGSTSRPLIIQCIFFLSAVFYQTSVHLIQLPQHVWSILGSLLSILKCLFLQNYRELNCLINQTVYWH